jgi:DNA helicase-2/ATP-dependent DNA helicase PcrA
VVGSLKFYEREEIKDALALLAFIVNPKNEVAFVRIVNKPTRGIGATTVEKFVIIAHADGLDLLAACRKALPGLPKKTAGGLTDFTILMEELLATLDTPADPPLPLSDFVWQAVKRSGLLEHHTERDEIAGTSRAANLEELANSALPYGLPTVTATPTVTDAVTATDTDTVTAEPAPTATEAAPGPAPEGTTAAPDAAPGPAPGAAPTATEAAPLGDPGREGLLAFLDHVELDRTLGTEDAPPDGVTLITLHNTKGLEFPRVIITGLERGIFPRTDKTGDDLEEERRLFYVGITRARDELYLTSCAQRRLYGRTDRMLPSPFLSEIDESLLVTLGEKPQPMAEYGGGV